MAFTVTNPINTDGASAVPGASNRALGLKLYTGEVIKAFDRMNIAKGTVKNRMISGGKSAQFIVTGQDADTGTTTHTPGATVVASVMKVDERVITIQDRIYFAHFVDDLDLKLAQYDIRGELAKQAAEALATKIDKEIFLGVYDLLADAGVVGQPTAGQIVNTGIANADAEVSGDALVASIYAASSLLNTKNVPMMGRVFITTPTYYNNIILSQKAVNGDWTNGNGGVDTGRVFQIGGIPIMWTNHLPATTTQAGFGITATNIAGMMYTPEVYGCVKAMDIQAEANYIPEKLGDLLVAFYALGHGPLNPTPLVTIHSAVTTDI